METCGPYYAQVDNMDLQTRNKEGDLDLGKKTRGMVWLLAASMTLLLVVAACSGDDDSASSSAATTAPAAQAAPTQAPAAVAAVPAKDEPAKTAQLPTRTKGPAVKRLKFGTTTPGLEHSDTRVLCCFNALQLRPMYENLLMVNPQGEFVPGLATEWTMEPDGKSMRIKLREGVQFHNGNGEFGADDIIHFFNEFVTFDKAHVFSRIFWKKYTEEIEKVNDHEVIMRMKAPNSFLSLALSDRWTQFPAVSKADFVKNGAPKDPTSTPLAGTGAYQFVSRTQGTNIVYEAAPDHWRVTPDFPELEMVWIPEASTRLSALMSGELHMTDLPPDLQSLPKKEGYKVELSSSLGTRVWMQFYAAFPDPKTGVDGWPLYPEANLLKLPVRKALNKAINRDEVMGAFAPNGEKMILNHFHPVFSGAAWNPDWTKNFESEYGYDPAAARSLLKEAGFDSKNPLKIKTRIRSCVVMAGCEDVTEGVAGYWSDIGVDVELVTIDSPTRNNLSRATRGGKAGLGKGIVDWVDVDNSSTHPVFALANRQTWHATGGVNGWANPEMYKIVGKIQGEMDWSKHTPWIREVGDLSFNLHANVPLWYLPAQVTVDPKIIADYTWNGTEHGTFTHLEEIKAVMYMN